MLFSRKPKELVIENGVLVEYNEQNPLYAPNIVIPAGVREIGSCVFQSQSIDGVTFPYGLEKIGSSAFYDVWGLTSVNIPATVRVVGESAFHECRDLTTVVFSGSNTQIGYAAFEGCENLKNISLPQNLKTIAPSLFRYCYSLTSVTIPSTVEDIGGFAFTHTGLRSLVIPTSVRRIACEDLFAGSDKLERLVLPSGFKCYEHMMGINKRCIVTYH